LFDPFGAEHLNAEDVRLSLEKTPRTHFVDYLTATLEAKHDGGRLYTIKASAGQLVMLYRWNVFRMFPSVYVVHSYRDDLLAQAVSFSIASQTGRWISSMEGKPNDPRFDADTVAFAMQHSAQQNTLIFLIARLAGLERCTVLYEHLIAEPETCLRKVCHCCRICFEAATMPQPSLRKQADHVNDAFARQFCAEMNQQLGLRE
jgi:LPS sulfotransferase NodH